MVPPPVVPTAASSSSAANRCILPGQGVWGGLGACQLQKHPASSASEGAEASAAEQTAGAAPDVREGEQGTAASAQPRGGKKPQGSLHRGKKTLGTA